MAILCHPCAGREYAAHDGTVAPAPLPALVAPLVIDDPDRRLSPDEAGAYLALIFPGIAPLDDAASIAAQVAARAPANRPAGVGPCGRCRAALRTTTAIELRREYRQVGTLARLRTWRESWRCRTCADAEADEHDHPHGRVNEQAVLL